MPPVNPFDYVFALRDNAFEPNRGIEGVSKLAHMSQLARNPLLVHLEPELMPLYVRKAGPFAEHEENFQAILQDEQYIPEFSTGTAHHLVLITGPEGSGKTTLGCAMIAWLKTCPPAGGVWRVFPEQQLPPVATAREQADQFPALAAAVKQSTRDNDYCVVMIDKLIDGSELAALQMYDDLRANRVVFLFLIGTRSQALARATNDARYKIDRFVTRELSPDESIEFTRTRLEFFRTDLPGWIANNHPLYPFDEPDIRHKVKSGALASATMPGSITLSTLGRVMADGLARRVSEYRKNLRPAGIADLTLATLRNELIELRPLYQSLLAA